MRDQQSQNHDRTIVEEMLKDTQSHQWNICRDFVKKQVQFLARNISHNQWEDLTQEVMIKIWKSIGKFRYQCSLNTWIITITRNCIADKYRKLKLSDHLSTSSLEYYDDEGETENYLVNKAYFKTPEEEYILRESVTEAYTVLSTYATMHTKEMRNKKIIQMVLIENCLLEEAAKAAGCSKPVAGYIVRSAQRYAREKLRG